MRAFLALPTAAITSTALLGAILTATPATADDQISWPSGTSMSATVAGVDLGNVELTQSAVAYAAWTKAVGSDFQPEVSRGGNTTWDLDTASATDSQTRMAMSADGTVGFAVYKKMVSGDRKLLWSRWDGSGWSPGSVIGTSVDVAAPPAVDLRADGTFGVVTWRASSASVFAMRFNGTTMLGPDTMASGTSGSLCVDVADNANRTLVGWVKGGDLESRAWNGNSWDGPRDASLNPSGSSTDAGQVALSSDGTRSMALWKVNTGSQWVVRAASGNGDTWNAAQPLHIGGYPSLLTVDLALSDSGETAFAAWSGISSTGGTSTYALQSRYSNGAWNGPTIMGGPYIDGTQPTPDVAISGDGVRGLIGYQQRSFAEYRAQARVFLGGTWAGPSSLGFANSSVDSGRTQVALTSNGTRGVAVTVQQSGGQQYLLLSQLTVFTSPGPPGAPVTENLTYAGITATRASWTPPTFDGNSPLLDYAVESEPAGVTCDPGASSSCLLTGMLPGTTYRLRVTARNSRGTSVPSEWSKPFPDVAPGPGPGPDPAAIAPTIDKIGVSLRKRTGPTRKVVIRWTAVGAPTSYRVRVTKPRGKKWKRWTTQTSARKVLKLRRGKVYRVGVEARNAAGSSPVVVKRFRVKR